jgi:protein-tyrosine phosphatase
MAEGIFRQLVADAGLSDAILIDSAGTSNYHAGEPAHPGTRRVLAKHGISYDNRARQIQRTDVVHPDTYVIAMDQENILDLRRQFGDLPRLYRLLDFASTTAVRDVPDPYYSNNFDQVYRLVEEGCKGLLVTIRSDEKLD